MYRKDKFKLGLWYRNRAYRVRGACGREHSKHRPVAGAPERNLDAERSAGTPVAGLYQAKSRKT